MLQPESQPICDPLQYGRKHNMPLTLLAYQLGYSSTAALYKIQEGRKPSALCRRVTQLLECLKQNGIEPPDPLFFD